MFVGKSSEQTLALAGTLVLRAGEWQSFGALLLLGSAVTGGQESVDMIGAEAIAEGFREAGSGIMPMTPQQYFAADDDRRRCR